MPITHQKELSENLAWIQAMLHSTNKFQKKRFCVEIAGDVLIWWDSFADKLTWYSSMTVCAVSFVRGSFAFSKVSSARFVRSCVSTMSEIAAVLGKFGWFGLRLLRCRHLCTFHQSFIRFVSVFETLFIIKCLRNSDFTIHEPTDLVELWMIHYTTKYIILHYTISKRTSTLLFVSCKETSERPGARAQEREGGYICMFVCLQVHFEYSIW